MYHVRQENLPFVGSSHEFVGAEQGNTGVSVFLFQGKPGSGPGPHRHPYDEIHSFKAVGDSPLVQLDIDLSPRFIQENL